MTYAAPLDDMRFVLDHVAGLPEIATLPGFEEAQPELVEAILTEAARSPSEVLAPLNATGDRQGCRWERGQGHHARWFPAGLPAVHRSRLARACRPAPPSAARECRRWSRARWPKCGNPPTWPSRCVRC